MFPYGNLHSSWLYWNGIAIRVKTNVHLENFRRSNEVRSPKANLSEPIYEVDPVMLSMFFQPSIQRRLRRFLRRGTCCVTVLTTSLALCCVLSGEMAHGQNASTVDDLGLTSAPSGDNPYHSRCATQRGCMTPCDSYVFMQADALALRKDVSGHSPLMWNGVTDIYSASELNDEFSVGPRIILGFRIAPQTTVETTWFDQKTWDGNAQSYDANGNLYSIFGESSSPIPGVEPTTQVGLYARSYLSNLELNLRRQVPVANENIRSSVFVGTRYFNFDDSVRYELGGDPMRLGTEANNDIFGGQVGGSLDFCVGNYCSIALQGAGGIAGNSYHVRQSYADTLHDRKDSTTTYFGDVDLSLIWRFTNAAALTVGYKAIWLDNIATGADNFGNDWTGFQNAMNTLNDRANAVYHGPHAGFELRY